MPVFNAEFYILMSYGIFMAIQKPSELRMTQAQARKIIMHGIAEYMIDTKYVGARTEEIWEDLDALQRNRINIQFSFIEEVVQVIAEMRSLFFSWQCT